MQDKEEIYDNEISPLIREIIAICEKHEIPFFVDFQFNESGHCRSTRHGYDHASPIFAHHQALSQCRENGGVNVDKYMFWVARGAREKGHSSIFLSQAGIPVTPKSESKLKPQKQPERDGMKNEVLERIKQFAIKELNAAYGYCGCAESDNAAMLNSDDKKGGEIRIKITLEDTPREGQE